MELIQNYFHCSHFEHPYIMASLSLSLCLFSTNPAHVLRELWAVNYEKRAGALGLEFLNKYRHLLTPV